MHYLTSKCNMNTHMSDREYQYIPSIGCLIINEDPMPNVRYRVAVLKEDETIDDTVRCAYFLKLEKNMINLYMEDGPITVVVCQQPLDVTTPKPQRIEIRSQTALAAAVMKFLLKKCPDLNDLNEMFQMLEENTDAQQSAFESAPEVNRPERPSQNRSRVPARPLIIEQITDEEFVLKRGKHIIIKGLVQSGKTNFMLCSAIRYMFDAVPTSSIIVLRNICGDTIQFSRRLNELAEQLNNWLRSRNVEGIVKLTPLNSNVGDKELRSALSGQNPQIFVLLGNDSQLGRVNEKIAEIPELERRYVLFIDESDYNESGESSRAQELQRMKDEANIVYHISATILDNAMAENIDAGRIHMLNTPENYHGFEKITPMYTVHNDSQPSNKSSDIPWEKDLNLNEWLDYFSEQEPYPNDWVGVKHPRHCLMVIGQVIEPQRRLFKKVASEYDIAVLLYNGEGIDLFHHSLDENSINLQCGRKTIAGKPTEWCPKAFTFKGDVGIADVIQWLKDNGGVDRFPRILTISGKMAGRGISFVSADYGKYLHQCSTIGTTLGWMGWRLTEMYMNVAQGTDQPNLIQVPGRLCCIVRDSMPTKLYCTEQLYKDIRSAGKLQDELIMRARAMQNHIEGLLFVDAFNKMKICQEKLSKRKLTLGQERNIPKNNRVLDDSREIGAVNMKEYLPPQLPNDHQDFCEHFGKHLEDMENKRVEAEGVNEMISGKLILPDQFSGRAFQIAYNGTIEAIMQLVGPNVWIRRGEILSKIQELTNMGEQAIKARLKDFGLKPNLHRDVENEAVCGLVLRKNSGQWEIRYNQ